MRPLILAILMLPLLSTGQQSTLDSLRKVVENSKDDSVKFFVTKDMAIEQRKSDPMKGIALLEEAQKIAAKSGKKAWEADALLDMGSSYGNLGEFEKALELLNKSLDLRKEISDTAGIAKALNNIGIIYYYKGDYDGAIEQWLKSVKIEEQLGHKTGMANNLNNIAAVVYQTGDIEKAIDYNKQALAIRREINDVRGMTSSLQNLSVIFQGQKEYERALVYQREALELAETLNDRGRLANVYDALSTTYVEMGNLDEAEKYALKAYTICKEMGIIRLVPNQCNTLGMVYNERGQYDKAQKYLEEGLALANQMQHLEWMRNLNSNIAETYQYQKKYKKALKAIRDYITLNDTLLNQSNSQQIAEMEAKYQNEKKELEIQGLNKDKLLQKSVLKQVREEGRRQSVQKWGFAGGFALMLVLAFVVFRSYRQKRKDNEIISHQKTIVEVQKEEILDSINYAKRIQEAILPPERVVNQYLKDSFILYKPKDIVAGDFYWLHGTDGGVIFGAADCTGHGVPGAMVSVVCHNALNRSVREFQLTEPGRILDKTRELVIETFEASDEEVMDGMDIALCSMQRQDNTLQFSGANNGAVIIPTGAKTLEDIVEIKPDKQPVGKYAVPKPFTTHKVELNPGDTLYIYSDGYPDQFGGPKGKKFMYKRFKQLLIDNVAKPMKEQHDLLARHFEEWRGDVEQVDDVCVIGVRV